MASVYTVQLPPGGAPGEAILIAEGFSWPALLSGPVWLIWNQAWYGLLAYSAVGLALAGIWSAIDPASHALLVLGFLWLVGASANDWLRREWSRRGWRMVDLVLAGNRTQALIIHLGRSARQHRSAAPPPEATPRRALSVGGSTTPLAPWSP